MKHLLRVLREPLLHFLAIGGLIFVLFAAMSEPGPEPADTIVVGPERIEQLARGFQAVWRRPPTDDELRAMIDDFVREEIYYREALALGLDSNDTVVRRRLRQKVEFLTDSGAEILEPVAGELETYLLANENTFSAWPTSGLRADIPWRDLSPGKHQAVVERAPIRSSGQPFHAGRTYPAAGAAWSLTTGGG